jgi:hypothetical protein
VHKWYNRDEIYSEVLETGCEEKAMIDKVRSADNRRTGPIKPQLHPELSTQSRIRLTHLADKCGLSLVYLFGSQVEVGLAILRGESPPVIDALADIDVGAVFRGELPPPSTRAEVFADMYGEMADIFSPHSLDLCFLQENHSVFQCSIFNGVNIYAIDDQTPLDYEEDIVRRAADFRPVLERYLDEILEEV